MVRLSIKQKRRTKDMQTDQQLFEETKQTAEAILFSKAENDEE
ncbi:hypothetical protein CHCC20335_2260 [Bacillus paralicheniformis]|nr:hypothetical protein CHCC20335_2260 [Bacillus paralicheniformis]